MQEVNVRGWPTQRAVRCVGNGRNFFTESFPENYLEWATRLLRRADAKRMGQPPWHYPIGVNLLHAC